MKSIHLLTRLCWGIALVVLLAAAVTSTAAAAPVIRVSIMKPDHVTPGRPMTLWVNVLNVGDEPFTGNMTIRYTFPAGLSVVDPSATGTLAGAIVVSGGGAGNSVTVPLSFSTDPIGPFDINSLDVDIADNPSLDPAQAGMNPPSIATGVELLSQAQSNFDFPSITVVSPPESFRDVVVHVPAGFVGYPTATAQRCTGAQLQEPAVGGAQVPNCP